MNAFGLQYRFREIVLPMNTRVETEALRDAAQLERLRLQTLIRQSQDTYRSLASAHRQLSEVVCRTRELVAASRVARLARQDVARRTVHKPINFLEILQSAGLNEADLPVITDDLIVAYQNASSAGEEKLAVLIGCALHHIGHHIARELGPRRVGFLLN